jgi:menaquinone-dependent protoporphyrinogen oxidase
MRILILYATVEGQTRKIAKTIAERLEHGGHVVTLVEANQVGYVDPGWGDAAVLCAPIHVGHYPTPFVHFVKNWRDELNSTPSAFVSVSLAAASDSADERAEAARFPRKLAADTGWEPAFVHNCAGALRYTEYDFFKQWMMKRISASEHRPTDTSKDYEYTDWNALGAFIDGFAAEAEKAAAARAASKA